MTSFLEKTITFHFSDQKAKCWGFAEINRVFGVNQYWFASLPFD